MRNDLLKLSEQHALQNLSEFIHHSRQLSVVTKLWIDPFYEKPHALSGPEKARQILKLISVNLAFIFALGAIICTFVFPPAAVFFGLASMVGMWPVIDALVEVGRNAWYGRSPTKQQAIELGIFIPMIALLMTGAHVLPAVGTAIMNVAPQVSKTLIAISVFITVKFMNWFNVIANLLGSIANWLGFTQSMKPRAVDQVQHTIKRPSSTSLIFSGTNADLTQIKTASNASGETTLQIAPPVTEDRLANVDSIPSEYTHQRR